MSATVALRLDRNSMPVTESGCWLWLGKLSKIGYGLIRIQGIDRATHRVSWQTFVSEIPDGIKVLHHCDIRCCINPDHLFLGTQADNIHDMDAKGRRVSLSGERNGRARLTRERVLEIRASTETYDAMARQYGVAKSTINCVRNGLTWRSL